MLPGHRHGPTDTVPRAGASEAGPPAGLHCIMFMQSQCYSACRNYLRTDKSSQVAVCWGLAWTLSQRTVIDRVTAKTVFDLVRHTDSRCTLHRVGSHSITCQPKSEPTTSDSFILTTHKNNGRHLFRTM